MYGSVGNFYSVTKYLSINIKPFLGALTSLSGIVDCIINICVNHRFSCQAKMPNSTLRTMIQRKVNSAGLDQYPAKSISRLRSITRVR